MSDPNKCPKCGGRKKPEFDLCYNCSQSSRSGGPDYQKESQPGKILPPKCIFSSFLNESNLPKKELYLDSAQLFAEILENATPKMTQGQIRQAFHMLNSMARRIKAERDITPEVVYNCFYKFAVQIEYQLKRGLIPLQFAEFVRIHTEVATKSIPEFMGFVEYLTSIMARMKTK